MATRETVVKGVGPGMTRAAFVAEYAGTVAHDAAGAVYDYAASRGLDCRFLVGLTVEEHSKFTNPAAIAIKDNRELVEGAMRFVGPTRSWGNTTEPSFGHPGLGPPFVRGRFTRYPSYAAGGIATIARLFEHSPYANARTVEAIIPIWAPPDDGNRTEEYIAGVVATMTRLEGAGMATPRIIDVRDKLPTRAGGGSGQRRAQTLGQVLHYSAVDYPPNRAIMDILIAEARYHLRTVATRDDPTPPLGEGGLAYHWTVDPVTGDLYLCRDEDAVLWHCGYWGPGGNGSGLAIHVPGGANLTMTPVAVQSLLWLLGRNEAKYGFGRGALKGHLELSQTSCPGPLMGPIVRPYRAGVLNYTGGASVAETRPNPVVIKDPITGHTVHPDLADSYQFEEHGRPLKPAVGYSDGVIRQLFERAVLEVGPDGAGRDTTATLGHAFLFVAGDRYPEWPGVKPQF